MNRLDQLMKAAKNMDWTQVVLHGHAPCFHVEKDGHFCGRALTWDGHRFMRDHVYVPLQEMMEQVAIEVRREMLS